MITFYDEVNYNIPGDTYFAYEGATYYLVHAEYDQSGSLELSLIEEVDMPSTHRSWIGEPRYADTEDEAIEIIDEIIDDLSA